MIIIPSTSITALYLCEHLVRIGHKVVCIGKDEDAVRNNLLTKSLPPDKFIFRKDDEFDVEDDSTVVFVDEDDIENKFFQGVKEFTTKAWDWTYPEQVSRYILISSDAVYPNSETFYSETSDPNPDTPYGMMKAVQERDVEYICDHLDAPRQYYILRAAQLYGAGIASRISDLCIDALHDRPIVVGKGRSDFCHIVNLCEAVEHIIKKDKDMTSGIYNVADGEPMEYESLAGVVRIMANTPQDVKNRTLKQHTTIDENKKESNIVVDISKLKATGFDTGKTRAERIAQLMRFHIFTSDLSQEEQDRLIVHLNL